MRTRKDKLQRFQIESPCTRSWEEMKGDARRRHCLECDKAVYDFAQLTPREIHGVIEASQGNLCARLTHDGRGRLVSLPPPIVANPLAIGRPSPLVTAVVTAALGLSGAVLTPPATLAASLAEQGSGERHPGHQPRRTHEAGGSLKGRLANEAGELVSGAEIRLINQIDGQERIAKTDAEGRFSFASVRAGLYALAATLGESDLVEQEDILLAAGEKQQIELTVPTDVWESLADGGLKTVTVGGTMGGPEPLRSLYGESDLIVLGVAGKSVVVRRNEYTSRVRTDLVISSVLKGDTRERVISVYHEQLTDEDPASRYPPGDEVLAFLKPQEAESGRGSDGYAATGLWEGLLRLSGAKGEAYRDRIEALAQISRRGIIDPAEILDWLVTTTENPATREAAITDLTWAAQEIEYQAKQRKIPVDVYARQVQKVFADFLSAGGVPERDVSPVILGAYLTDAHRERLTAALLSPPKGAEPDAALYELVAPWHENRLLPWVIDRIKTADLSSEAGEQWTLTAAVILNDEGFENLRIKGNTQIQDLKMQIYRAADDTERQSLGKQLEKAKEELRRQLLEALAKRR